MKLYNKITLLIILICYSVGAQTPPDEPKDDFIKSLEGIEWVIIVSHQTIVLESSKTDNLIIPGYNEIEEDLKFVENKSSKDQGYFVFKKGNNLIIRDFRKRGTSTTIFLPKNKNIKVKSLGLHNIYLTNFTGEIEAEAVNSGHVTLKDCTGAAIIHTSLGNIRVFFENVKQSASLSAITSLGNISIVLPEDAVANVDLEAGTNRVQSDFKIQGRSIKTIGEKVKGTINGGGPKIMLVTTFGNISIKTLEY